MAHAPVLHPADFDRQLCQHAEDARVQGITITHDHMTLLLRKHDTHITEKEGAGIVRRRLPVED